MITPPITDNVALAVVGGLALVLIGVLGMVMRSIVRGDLVPGKTVERNLSERDERIRAQASALGAASDLIAEQSRTIGTQADSIADFGQAQILTKRVADALHQVTEGGAL